MYMDFDLLKKCDFFFTSKSEGKKKHVVAPPPPSYSLEWGGNCHLGSPTPSPGSATYG